MAFKTVVITVGMGSNADPEGSLYIPLERSMREAGADVIWLFSSAQSYPHAALLRDRFPDLPIRVAEPLPQQVEEDPSACYLFFLERLKVVLAERGVRARDVTLDYTRGTKTMSAAVLLAAVSLGIEKLVYVSGKRGENNLVAPGTEEVRQFSGGQILAYREMEQAEGLMRLQRYAAVDSVLSGWQRRYPAALHGQAAALDVCAQFWDAWDRFDYLEAVRLLSAGVPAGMWYSPTEEAKRALVQLAESRVHATIAERQVHTWALVFDMLENARRRVRQRQYEDALLRAYRSLELIGQAVLYGHGYDSAGVDAKDPQIEKWIAYRRKEGKSQPECREGVYLLSKDLVGSLLKFLKDPMASRLNSFDQDRTIQAKMRNESLLVHGFKVHIRAERVEALDGMLSVGLKELARKGVPDSMRPVEQAVVFPVAGS